MQTWACALFLLGVAAPTLCQSGKFSYNKNPFRRSEDCDLCYEKDCLTWDQARCDYYSAVDGIMSKGDDAGGAANLQLRKEIDYLLYELIVKVPTLSKKMQCIPYVSRHTTCNKENLCLGCKSCSCSPNGSWNCTVVQPCHIQDALNIDHRVLLMVMESLLDSGRAKKTKRSVTDYPEDTTKATPLTFEILSEWIYGVKPLNYKKASPTEVDLTDATSTFTDNATATTDRENIISALTTTEVITEAKNNREAEYVGFDEVLRGIAGDNKSYSRRKPLDDKYNNTFSVDDMIVDESKDSNITTMDEFEYMMNFMDDEDITTETAVGGVTKMVIDLLKTAGTFDPEANINITGEYFSNNKDIDLNTFENTNDVLESNVIKLVKRGVSTQENIKTPVLGVPTVTIIVNTTNTTQANNTDQPTDLKEHVLVPLNKIIIEKIKELENLRKIRENLLKFVKNKGNEDLPTDFEKDSVTSNSYFSIYNLALEKGLDLDLRRANPIGYDKYMFKLKTDIFEVVRDIVRIQKQKNSDIPDDLKFLLTAMKRYVYKNKFVQKQTRNKQTKLRTFRRRMNSVGCDYISYKDCLVRIFEVMDKNMPKSNALAPLSLTARRVLRHIVETYYVEELFMPGLRVHDPKYNLTNDLQSIGSKWQEMTANIMSSIPFDSLHRMKLLHYVLVMDVSKMSDALSLINFAHSRRMLPSLDKINSSVLDRISSGLTAVHNQMQIIVHYYSQNKNQKTSIAPHDGNKATVNPKSVDSETQKVKNRSFINHIRTLLKSSKKDIAELLHRKVPKSEIVKQLAKKKMDEISEKRYSEYEETMKRWQNNLELVPKVKRSVVESFKTRMKNIIPNYLRHKVSKVKKNSTTTAMHKANDKKQMKTGSKRDHKTRKGKGTTRKPQRSNDIATTKTKGITTQVPMTTPKPITPVTLTKP